jgi:hypothetical protein
MADKPILHVVSNKQSSPLNGEVLSGAAKGALIGAVIPGAGHVLGAAIGAVAGGVGKHIQDNQSIQQTGGIVEEFKPPTIFNREMLMGTAGAVTTLSLGGGLLTGALGIGGVAAGIMSGGLVPLALGGLALAATVAIPVGAGIMGKGRMEREYAAAEIAVKQQAGQSSLTKARAVSAEAAMYKNSAPLAEIQAGMNSVPVQGGAVERVLAARQAGQLQVAGSPS